MFHRFNKIFDDKLQLKDGNFKGFRHVQLGSGESKESEELKKNHIDSNWSLLLSKALKEKSNSSSGNINPSVFVNVTVRIVGIT